jgi:hypothetical protein
MQNNPVQTLTKNQVLIGFTAICISIFSTFPRLQFAAFAQRSSVETKQSVERNNRSSCQNIPSSSLFIRTELLFGLQKSDGSEVSNSEFQMFLDREITPRFPDGLTLITGQGQFRNSQNIIIKEKSRLLILLHPIERETSSNRSIEIIREAYKNDFKQESVVRSDNRSCVSF